VTGDKLLLHKIYTLKPERSQGGASKLLQHLLEHAGNHNKTVVVDIAPFEFLDKEDPERFVTTGLFEFASFMKTLALSCLMEFPADSRCQDGLNTPQVNKKSWI
jgi:GNAT superfamily N-acetyltransferase